MKPKGKNWLIVLVWMAGILYFSSRQDPIGYFLSLVGKTSVATAATTEVATSLNAPSTNLDHRPIWLNFVAHFSEYMGLMLLLLAALYMPKKASLISTISIATGIALCFAVFDEVFQGFWPGRGFAISDLCLDLLGIITASIIFVIIRRKLIIVGNA